MRFTIEDILKREPAEDTYAFIFATAKYYDPMEVRKLLPLWTSREKIEDAKYWEGMKQPFGYHPEQYPIKSLEDFENELDNFLDVEE